MLGEGATGVVYRVSDSQLGCDLALKVVRPNLAMHQRFRARFAREVALSASVVHHRIVPVYDYGHLPDRRPYVALAYADRGSLGDLLRSSVPRRGLLRVIGQVLEGLSALHALGLVHQDLKPENVLLHGTDGDAWVADLGAAGALSELAMDRRGICGTPGWMAPEQVRGLAHELGPWTDLYAVGRMLAWVFLGAPPAGGSAPAPPDLQRGLLPPAFDQIVRNLLSPEPRQRYDRAADVRRALSRAIAVADAAFLDAPCAPVVPVADPSPEAPAAEAAVDPAPGIVRWNRVPPGTFPAMAPPPAHVHAPQGISLQLFALQEMPMLGRQMLQQTLWNCAREVVDSGAARVLILEGSTGSDRNRLAIWLARALDQGGFMEPVRLRYDSPPDVEDGYRGAVLEYLAPWSDTRFEAEERVARWLARDRECTPEEVRTEAEVLVRWCGYSRESEPRVNAAVGLAFLYRHLKARAWRGGALLVLEDVHHAREPGDGLAICESLLEASVGERPVLAVATVDAGALRSAPPLAAKIAALEARGARRILVPRLPDAELAELLCDVLCVHADLAEAISTWCRGEGGVATLLLRHFATCGLLRRESDGTFRLRDGVSAEEHLPQTPDGLYRSRIDGAITASEASDDTARALAVTALAGPYPPIFVVRRICPEGLDHLLASGLVHQRGRRLVFEHPGVARSARWMAADLPTVAELHSALAEAWENLGRYTGADVDLRLGQHRLYAGDHERALIPLLRAAKHTLIGGRAALALEAAREAWDAAELAGVRMAAGEAGRCMADAYLDLGHAQQALDVIDAALALGHLDRRTRAGLEVRRARARLALGELEDGRRLLSSARKAFEAMRDWEGLVETARGEGMLARHVGRPLEGVSCYTRMLTYNRGGDPRVEVLALVGLVESLLSAGRLAGLEKHLARLQVVARSSGDTRNICQATYVGGLVHLRRRRLELAERHFQTARALAATLGADRLRLACENNLGEVFRYRGDFDAAVAAYRRGAHLADDRGWSAVSAVAHLNLALVAITRDELRQSLIDVARADEALREHPRHWGWTVIGLIRAVWGAECGDEELCRIWWVVAKDHGLENLRLPDLLIPLRQLVEATRYEGWDDIAEAAHRLVMDMGLEPSAPLN